MANKIKPYINVRKWGYENRFSYNTKSTVKILNVKNGKKLSVQYHHKRDEFWHVISGKGKILIGEKWHKAKKGDHFFMPKKTIHSAEGVGEELRILEISFGTFDQKDIVRLK